MTDTFIALCPVPMHYIDNRYNKSINLIALATKKHPFDKIRTSALTCCFKKKKISKWEKTNTHLYSSHINFRNNYIIYLLFIIYPKISKTFTHIKIDFILAYKNQVPKTFLGCYKILLGFAAILRCK